MLKKKISIKGLRIISARKLGEDIHQKLLRSTFYKIFKEKFGMTPREYKKISMMHVSD